ncbi:MAG: Hsp70 family protein [Micromonosporaceae bacterium]
MYALGIDLGTTFTAAAVWRDGHAEIASLGSRAPVIPSVVLLREDETILTGEAASRRGMSEPHRVSREFKRRLGDTTPIILGGVPYSAEQLMARLLRQVVQDIIAREGGKPSQACVCHPANWGPYKRELLEQAVRLADVDVPVTYITEPEAAAIFYAQQQRVDPGAMVAVYDLGGGTFDATVLRKTRDGFEILGEPEGIERLGGIDFDAAVFAHVNQALGGKLDELDEDDPAVIAAVARLREECVAAKEALSTDTDASIPVLLPNLATEVRLTRVELEAMIRPALHSTIEALRRALRSARVEPEQLHSVLLVGGSSRIPLVAQLVGAELGRPVAVDAHPKHAVALGAAWQASGQAGPAPARSATASPPPSEAATASASSATSVAAGPAPATTGRTAAGPTGPVTTAPKPPAGDLVGPGRRYQGTATVPVTSRAGSGDGAATVADAGSAGPASPVPSVVGPHDGGRRRSRWPLVAGAGLLAAALAAAGVGWSLAGRVAERTAQQSPPSEESTPPADTGSTAPEQPADEQCTDAIRSNPRWVCLTSARVDGNELVIEYEADFAGDTPNVDGGYHLHLYGGDGTEPPDEVMGTHAAHQGRWQVDDRPSPLRYTLDHPFVVDIVGDQPKVCARIANGQHALVEAVNGGYTTGNCVPIDRS